MSQSDPEIVRHACPQTYGVVIPTIATPGVLLPTLRRLLARLPEEEGVVISLCLNPVPATVPTIPEVEADLERLARSLDGTPHLLVWENVGRAIGFGHAVNRGIQLMLEKCGLPELTVLFNDDLRVTPGWLEGLRKASQAAHVRSISEPPSVQRGPGGRPLLGRNGQPVGVRPDRSRAAYGRVGIIGPCSVNVAGMQAVQLADKEARVTEANADHFAALFRRDNAGEYVTTNFLSGFCMALTAECLLDLAIRDEDGKILGVFDGDQYPIAGYEDNDLCVRAEKKGWRLLIDGETFIYHLGHQSFDAHFPEMNRGMRNRLRYYEAWRTETQRPQKVVAIYRAKMETGQDLGYFKTSLVGMSRLVDGFAIVLTDNPLEVARSPDFKAILPTLSEIDREWLQGCVKPGTSEAASPEQVAEATRRWIVKTLRAHAREKGGQEVPVKVKCWTGQRFNERDERNEAIALGESMGADWLWSVDHDEIPEERVRRWHVDRWLSHPDPMVHSWDFGWLNHWDSERQIRADFPWGDARGGVPTYKGGMHGFRLWRVNKANPRRILGGTANGLHCGNCPDASMEAKRVAGFRFRHLGYLRHFDRVRKLRRYSEQDPNPDPWLVGGDNYGHLVQEEGAVFYPYVEINGIGLHLLVYEKESPDDVARVLDWTYGLVDAVVLTWTGEWKDEDKGWTEDPEAPWTLAEWPSTGPSRELAKYAALFGAKIIHQPLADHFAEARNAGIRELAKLRGQGIGWSLFLDPDEHFQEPYSAMVSLRRMAEVSNGWGWLFRFYNLQPGNTAPTLSESVRMSRIDPEGIMLMDGRVHEGFDLAFQKLHEHNEHPQLRYAPFNLLNVGQKITDEEMEAKLEKYARLLRLELEDNPLSPKAWVSLGLHAENQGDEQAAMVCYQRGMLCPGNSYLPFKEAALYHLRMARILYSEVVERVSTGHGFYKLAAETLEWLRENAPDRPLLGRARIDPSSRKGLGFPLPAFPLEEEPKPTSPEDRDRAILEAAERYGIEVVDAPAQPATPETASEDTTSAE